MHQIYERSKDDNSEQPFLKSHLTLADLQIDVLNQIQEAKDAQGEVVLKLQEKLRDVAQQVKVAIRANKKETIRSVFFAILAVAMAFSSLRESDKKGEALKGEAQAEALLKSTYGHLTPEAADEVMAKFDLQDRETIEKILEDK